MHPTKESFNFDQCISCNLVMLNPRVLPDELHRYYTAYYLPYRGAKAWGKYENFVKRDQEKMDKKRVGILNKLNPLTASTQILDVGCGKPTFLQEAYESYKLAGIGLDFSDHGWKTEQAEFNNLDLRVGEIDKLSLDTPPDFITMWHYMEHDYAPDQTLRTLAKIAKPETYLVVEVPNFDSESRKNYQDKWAGWHTPRHTFLYAPENMTLLMKNNGWEVKEIRPKGTLSDYLLYWMSEMETKGIDWRKNMEEEFWGFARGMMKFQASNWFRKKDISHGIMLAIAKPVAV